MCFFNISRKNSSEILDAMHLPEQARLYMGPLEEDVIANDVTKQFCQFGTIHLVQRIRYSMSFNYGTTMYTSPILAEQYL